MSKILNTAVAAMLGAALLAPGLAEADCKLLQLAEFHLDPKRTSPIVDGTVNGHPVKVLLDTGANSSMITHYQAGKLGLRMAEAEGVHAYGIGGATQVYTAHIDHLTVGDLAKASFDMTVAGDQDQPSDVSIVLGDDVLSNADIEFDLAHNAIRLFKPKGCTAPQLVYWGAAYSQAELLPWGRENPAIQTKAYLNGRQVLATLDSGAGITLIDAVAAEAAGATRADPTPLAIHGEGPSLEQSWIGQFDTFALGDEKIAHVNVRVAHFAEDMSYTEIGSNLPRRLGSAPSMYVGDDFLRAHRVFVDNEDHLILFSYQGGPVFNVAKSTTTAPVSK